MHWEGNNVLRNLLAVSWAQLLSVKPIDQIKTKPCKAGASHFSRKALHPLCKFAGNERVHPVQRGQRCYRAPSICETHKSNSIWGSLCQCISLYSAGIKISKRWKHWRSSKELWKGNCMRKEKDSVGWCNGKIVERKNKYQNQKMQAETEKVKSGSLTNLLWILCGGDSCHWAYINTPQQSSFRKHSRGHSEMLHISESPF